MRRARNMLGMSRFMGREIEWVEKRGVVGEVGFDYPSYNYNIMIIVVLM